MSEVGLEGGMEVDLEVSQEAGLLVCTRKGLIVGRSSGRRSRWDWQPIAFGGWVADYAVHDPHSNAIWAAVNTAQWGPRMYRSEDGGERWCETAAPSFAEGERSVEAVWTIAAGAEAGTLYAGVLPAALFISRDDGASWELCSALDSHPSKIYWAAGPAGLIFHHICPDPDDPLRIVLGGSATGVYVSEDGGRSWETRNGGVRGGHLPLDGQEPAGHCVHSMLAHPLQRGRLWQQNHFGQYRSDDDGRSWVDVGEGLPGEFGFATAIDPHDPDAAWFVPLDSDQTRTPRGGALAVWRTRNAGQSWQPLTDGLPQREFHQSVLRQALSSDHCNPLGLYLGTSGGELYASRDGGDSWSLLRDHLAAVTAVRAFPLDG